MAAGHLHRSTVWQVTFIFSFTSLYSMPWFTLFFFFCFREALPYLVISVFGNINFRNVFPFYLLMQIAEDYSHCELVLRLPGYCPSMLADIPIMWFFEVPSISPFVYKWIYLINICFEIWSACLPRCNWCSFGCEEIAQISTRGNFPLINWVMF